MPFTTAVITFCVFFVEALIHYNIGKNGGRIHFPVGKELLQMVTTLAIFSSINGYLVYVARLWSF